MIFTQQSIRPKPEHWNAAEQRSDRHLRTS
jgi:hypothetical protein